MIEDTAYRLAHLQITARTSPAPNGGNWLYLCVDDIEAFRSLTWDHAPAIEAVPMLTAAPALYATLTRCRDVLVSIGEDEAVAPLKQIARRVEELICEVNAALAKATRTEIA